MKLFSADGSVGSPHVRVGHRQALNTKAPVDFDRGFFILGFSDVLLERSDKIVWNDFARAKRARRANPMDGVS